MRLAIAAFALIPTIAAAAPHPFDVHDLVMMERVSDPQLSPDGKRVAYQLRQTDYEANKGVNSVWVMSLSERNAKQVRLTETAFTSQTSARWSPDGGSVYVLGSNKDEPSTQVWRIDASKGGNGAAQRLTNLPLDVNNYKLSPDGKQILLSMDVFTDCADLACTKKRLDEKAANKASGMLYDKVFIRHWDTWADGRRSQLFIADVPATGAITAPRLLTKGIDGDVPSKPFGDDGEYAFSPDGKTVYFDARIAGKTEPWSTNFDIYSVPADGSATPKNLTPSNAAWDANPLPSADGKTLFYAAMKRPTFEADRFGIMALDLASGQTHEIDPKWDRSAGALQLSKDGKTLFTATYDNGDHALFAIDVGSGKATRLGAPGHVEGFSVRGNDIVFARSTLKTPADLFRIGTGGGKESQVTHLNTERLADARMGDYEFYTFKGADNATVQGFVVKPVGYEKGKKYPVAFIIHGGPQGAMTNDFHYRWNPQTYAGAGFAVVTVNFHGSTGYGQAFTDAISGDWGGKPLEDLQKGFAAAIDRNPWIDGDRACALGGSYGGYMVNWIAGNWPDRFRCLVTHAGNLDERFAYFETEELWFPEWEHGGTPWENPEGFAKHNPINHVSAWKTPMLVVHGAKDYRVVETGAFATFTA
ncbi:MAG TPA: S9 family peptidase, partial [Rudaea sp.]|nr:S9 family peptidase [Rudaea sp.]